MNYLTCSPIYEFPYSSNNIPSVPFSNYNPNGFILNIIPLIDSSIQNQISSFTVQKPPQITSAPDKNATVYQVPENLPLDTILRQFGVDTNSIQRVAPSNTYQLNIPLPLELVLQPPAQRRRRLICREESDSDNDYCPKCSSYHKRNHHDFEYYRRSQSPPHVHNILADAWNKMSHAPRNLLQTNSNPNLNSQWQAMKNASTPTPFERQQAVQNVWNEVQQPSKKKPSRLASFFSRKKPGTIIQPPPTLQPNQAAMDNFFAARNLPAGINQQNSAVSNVWNNAVQQSPLPISNRPWNQMPPPSPVINSAWNQMSRASPPPPLINSAWNQMSRASPPPPIIDSAWNQMSRASPPPQQPFRPIDAAWNQMSRASPPPQQPFRPIDSAWNQMSRASPPPQEPFYSQGSPVNSSWNRMQRSSSLLQNPAYRQSSMGAPQQAPYMPAGPPPFASLLARSYTQQSPYIGAM